MPIAVQTKCLALPLRQALHTAGRTGADGVEIDLRTELPAAELSDTALRQLRKLLDDLNLRIGATAFPTRRGYAEPDQLDRRLEATLAAMRAASRLGSRMQVVTLGPLPLPDASEYAVLVEALTELSGQGNRLGVSLALHTTASPQELEDLLKRLPEGAAGVALSPADLIHSGVEPLKFVQQAGRRVIHVYANDAVRGWGAAGSADVELGRGSAEFPELLGALEEHGYRGWLTVERRQSRQAADELANAVAYLRSL
jgi:sugar phosphate isomerase/epimerase